MALPSIPHRKNGRPGRPEAQRRYVLGLAAELDIYGKAAYKITEISKLTGIPYETCRLWVATERKKQKGAQAPLAGGQSPDAADAHDHTKSGGEA